MSRFAFAALLGSCLLACGGGKSEYHLALDRGAAAERAGRDDEARAALDDAAERASSDAQRDEALYRSALVGRRGEAPLETVERLRTFARERPRADRAPRALLDAARILEREGKNEEARGVYDEVVTKYPQSSGALSAAERVVVLTPGSPSAAWQKLVERNRERELDAGLRYHWALSLEEAEPRAALREHEEVVRRDPLPMGRFSDEALLHAARLRRRLGDIDGALQTLEALSSSRGHSMMVGSYERSSFAEARFLEAEILRDDAHRISEAESAFLRLANDHPTSRLGDDALFQAATIAHHEGRASAACRWMKRLSSEHADSVLRVCEPLFCEADAAPVEKCCGRAAAGFPTPGCD